MELGLDDPMERGLRGYVRLVTDALDVPPEGSYVSPRRPANAYVALDCHLPDFPAWDVALLWDERHGWWLAVEPRNGKDLIAVEYLGGDVLPAPQVVAHWAAAAVRGAIHPAAGAAPRLRAARDLSRRLRAYARHSEAPAAQLAIG